MEKTKIGLLDNVEDVGLFDRLKIFENNNIEAEPTDFAILSGANKDGYGFTPYWTSTSGDEFIAVVTSIEWASHKHHEADRFAKSPAIRPVIKIDSIENKSLIKGDVLNDDEVLMGEYPSEIEFDEDKQIELDRMARLSKNYMKTDKRFNLGDKEPYQEYVLDGQKYIRFICRNENQILSNGEECVEGKAYWVKVKPIVWLVEKEKGLLISKYGLLSGISYWLQDDKDINFEKSNMYAFLNDKMLNDILTISTVRKVNDYTSYLSSNPFNLSADDLSYTDLAKELLKSGVTPFFHGDTGVGKSARVMQIDPNAKIIYLCNQSLDSINGKSVYVPPVVERDGDNIEVIRDGMMQDKKPTWLKSFEERAKVDDNMHLVFFDEITNAPLAIQGFCFNIILDREVNGIWKLPDNAGVIAAGNEIDESISANELAEPLFSRFGHIYISDNVKEWLNWAISSNIHPAIIAYMTFTNGVNLRTKYTGINPNADPRKWEMASKVLYETHNIALLNGLVGEEVTKSFMEFCRCKPISLEDVINGNYNESSFIMDTNKKYVTALALSRVDMDNFEKVYSFMQKIGEEPLALFESLWTKDNPERLMKLREIKELERASRISRREELEQKVRDYHAEIENQIANAAKMNGGGVKHGK